MNKSVEQYLNTQARLDSFYNPTNGFGGEKATFNQTYFIRNVHIGQNTAENLYTESGIARNVVDIPAWEMVKGGVDFFVTDDQDETLIDEIEQELDRLDWDVWNYKALIEAGKMGGAGLVFTMDDGTTSFDGELTKSKGIINIQVANRWQLNPLEIDNEVFSENYGLPLMYRTSIPYYATHFTENVHHSRVIRFTSPFVGVQNQAKNHSWSESVYTHIYRDIMNNDTSRDTASETLQKFWQATFHTTSLEKWKGSKDDTILGAMWKRMENLFQKRGITNVAVVQKGMEELTWDALPVAGLAEIINLFPKQVSSSSRIPYDRLFTGESGAMGADIIEGSRKNFQDWILARQKMNLAPAVRKWLKMISTYMGFDPEKIGFKFRDLEQLNDLELAEMRLKVAQHDDIYMNQGTLSPDEVSKTRFSGRVPDYTSMRLLEGDRKTLEEIDEMDQEEMEKQTEQLNNMEKDDGMQQGNQEA